MKKCVFCKKSYDNMCETISELKNHYHKLSTALSEMKKSWKSSRKTEHMVLNCMNIFEKYTLWPNHDANLTQDLLKKIWSIRGKHWIAKF